MSFSVPVIDISPYLAGDEAQTSRIASEIDSAFRSSGFLQLTGHGISASTIKSMIKHTADFHALPEAKKREIEGQMRGYQAPELGESLSSTVYKEGFFMGRHLPGRSRRLIEGNRFLKDEDLPGFKEALTEYFGAMESLAVTLLRLVAIGLGVEEKFFDQLTTQEEGVVLCRFHRYHPQASEQGSDVVGLAGHADTTAVTILYQDGVGGLQVQNETTKAWENIKPVENAFVINLGNVLARWTNDTYLAAQHRVILPKDQFRYSAAYFMTGWLDQVVECIPTVLKNGQKPKYKPVTIEEIVSDFMKEAYDTHGPVKAAATTTA